METAENTVNPLVVIGADLDTPLVRRLQVDDEILLEMNGCRMYSPPALARRCPLVAELPWKVEQNNKKGLRLRHPSLIEPLELPYDNLMIVPKSPAVFKIEKESFATGPIYCILQFIGFYIQSDQVTEYFPNHFNESLCADAFNDERVRIGLLEKWSSVLQTFRQNGFGYKSIKRLSLLSQVAERDIQAIRNEDWEAAWQLSNEQLIKIQRTFSWLPHYLKQSSFIQHDCNTEYVADGKDSDACSNSTD